MAHHNNEQRDYKNLIIAVIAIITLVFGGNMVSHPLGLTDEQNMFFGGMVALAVIVFLVWMAIRVNRKQNGNDDTD